jgi:hypothetical protein
LLLSLAFAAGAAVPVTDQAQLVEFYHQELDHYFVSAEPAEIAVLDSGTLKGWARTGKVFPVVKPGAVVAGSTPVCRFYGRPEAKLDSHFYSASVAECATVETKFADAWQLEAREVFRAFLVDSVTGKCPADTQPVRRLWNNRADVNHRYTIDPAVYQTMLSRGYLAEGDGDPRLPTAFCTPMPTSAASTSVCTIAASPAQPVVGATLLLQATCTNSPLSFAWVGCTGTGSTCATGSTIAGAASYQVVATNAAGVGLPATATVSWQASGTAVPVPPSAIGNTPACTMAIDPASPAVGSTATLTANCSFSPTRYDWMECSSWVPDMCNVIATCPTTASTCRVTQSAAGWAAYAVAGGNAAGLGTRASLRVEWGGSPSTPAVPNAVPVCSLSASSNPANINSTITLAASCSGSPTQYRWVGCSTNGTSCTVTETAAGPRTYSLTASNATGHGNPASLTVNWQAPLPPSCTVSASPTAPFVGQSVTVSATCGGSPSSFTWTGCTAVVGAPSQCTDASAVAGNKAYSVVAANAAGPSAPAVVSVPWQAAPTAVPVCTLTAARTTAFTNEQVVLTAACTNPPLSSYTWTGCNGSGNTCTVSATQAGSQSYSVRARNAAGDSNPASVVIDWQQSAEAPDFCSRYADVTRRSATTGSTFQLMTRSFMTFGPKTVMVVSYTVPASASASTVGPGMISVAEYGGPPTVRQATLSLSPCDFRTTRDSTGTTGPVAIAQGQTASLTFSIAQSLAGAAALTPGRTYYYNVRNYDTAQQASSCSQLACDAIVVWSWPR